MTKQCSVCNANNALFFLKYKGMHHCQQCYDIKYNKKCQICQINYYTNHYSKSNINTDAYPKGNRRGNYNIDNITKQTKCKLCAELDGYVSKCNCCNIDMIKYRKNYKIQHCNNCSRYYNEVDDKNDIIDDTFTDSTYIICIEYKKYHNLEQYDSNDVDVETCYLPIIKNQIKNPHEGKYIDLGHEYPITYGDKYILNCFAIVK